MFGSSEFDANRVPGSAYIGLEPNFCFFDRTGSLYKKLEPNFLEKWFISSALVAALVGWCKRRVRVAWYQVVCLPRIVRSKAFFTDVADNCAVTN